MMNFFMDEEPTKVLDPVTGGGLDSPEEGREETDETKLFDGGGLPEKPDNKKRRRGIIIAIIVAAIFIAGAVAARSRRTSNNVKSIETQTLSRGKIEQTVSADGTVISAKTTLIDNSSGMTVRRIYAPVGSSVGQGTALCLLQNTSTNRYTTVYSSATGTVTSVSAVVGAPASGLLFTIQDTNNLVVSLKIKPENINDVQAGMRVNITSSATDDTTFHATISRVSTVADGTEDGSTAVSTEEKETADTSSNAQSAGADSEAASQLSGASSSSSGSSSDTTYTAIAPVEGAISGLHIGLKTKNEIVTASKENVYTLPFDAITKNADGDNIIFVVRNGRNKQGERVKKLKALKVSLGVQSDTAVEVMAGGLKDGMTVALSADELHAGQTVTVK